MQTPLTNARSASGPTVPASAKCRLDRLQQAIRGELPGAEQDALAVHLDRCQTCRDALEQLSGGTDWSGRVQAALRGVDQQTLDRRRDAAHAGGLALVLEPCEDPARLGRIGQYEVESFLGRGGMGIVVRAIDPALQRRVAIKVLAPEFAASPTARRRFIQEAQSAAAVVHDHVVAIHAVDTTAPLPFLVMQWIDGPSLQERMRQGPPLAAAQIAQWGEQIARGLAAAHGRGLVHRDIKPANILLEADGQRARLTDFGLARAMDGSDDTFPGLLVGTPQYMSPEQARGEPLDHRSDLFSLGSLLYALCAGRSPFQAESTPAVLRRVCEEAPQPLATAAPATPRALATLIERLLAKDPRRRPSSAGEVAEALARALQQNDRAASGSAGTPVRSRARRWGALAAVLLLCGATGLYALQQANHPTPLPGPAPPHPPVDILDSDGPLPIEPVPVPPDRLPLPAEDRSTKELDELRRAVDALENSLQSDPFRQSTGGIER